MPQLARVAASSKDAHVVRAALRALANAALELGQKHSRLTQLLQEMPLKDLMRLCEDAAVPVRVGAGHTGLQSCKLLLQN